MAFDIEITALQDDAGELDSSFIDRAYASGSQTPSKHEQLTRRSMYIEKMICSAVKFIESRTCKWLESFLHTSMLKGTCMDDETDRNSYMYETQGKPIWEMEIN